MLGGLRVPLPAEFGALEDEMEGVLVVAIMDGAYPEVCMVEGGVEGDEAPGEEEVIERLRVVKRGGGEEMVRVMRGRGADFEW